MSKSSTGKFLFLIYIYARILARGPKYPGKHNASTARTSGNLKPLQPKAQYMLIWKALIEYVGENVRAGKSVNVKKFGCFTYNI